MCSQTLKSFHIGNHDREEMLIGMYISLMDLNTAYYKIFKMALNDSLYMYERVWEIKLC